MLQIRLLQNKCVYNFYDRGSYCVRGNAMILLIISDEHIRERLFNYSQDSKILLDGALKNKSKIDGKYLF